MRPESAEVGESRPAAPTRDRWDRLFPSSAGIQDAGSSLNVAGLQLGTYQILDRIGRGGMGAVFRANDLRLDRIVALKILAPEYTRDPACVQRFQNEARAAAKLDHQNIARIFSSGEDSGQQYIAFEYVSGTNVRDMIQQRGTLTPAETVNYILQIAESLRHTSAMGVVHRDIKPSNIIITPTGRAKLVDLGLARHRTEGSDDLTVHGTTLGTFDYISPEQALDPRNVDVRSDLYSLGCTAFHMLTGEPPYNRGSMFQKVLDHHKVDVPDASSKNPMVPQALSHIVRKMMASQVDDRYQRPEDVIRDLLPLANSLGVPTRTGLWADVPAPRFSWIEHRGWVIALSLLAIIGVVASLPPQEVNPAPYTAPPPTHGVTTSSADPQPTPPPETSTDRPPGDSVSVTNSSDTAGSTRASAAESDTPAGGLLKGTLLDDRVSGLGPSRLAASPALAKTAPAPTATSPESQSPPSSPAATEFWVITSGLDGTSPTSKSYTTLEAACLDAPDHSTIELRFDGETKPQRPVRIDRKSLRIRAMDGRRPILVFEVSGPVGEPVTSQMISVINGELEMFNLDLVFRVPPRRAIDRWSIFSLGYAKKLTLQGVSVTLENMARQQPATLFEIKPPSGNRAERIMPDVMQRGPSQITITDSLLRGEADDGFHLDEAHNTRIDMMNSAWALSGTLLSINTVNSQQLSTSIEPPPCLLKLDHVTAVLGGSLISVVSGKAGVIPTVDVRCDNSLISLLQSDRAMVSMSGSLDLDEWNDRLKWQGASNYLDVQSLWWEIASSPARKFNAADWGQHWNSTGNTPIDHNVFESAKAWEEPVFHQVAPQSFYLFSNENNAYKAPEAADGTDVGVNWKRVRLPSNLPMLNDTGTK